jgi:hypothetical protein
MGLESLRAMLDTLEGLQAEQVVIKENIGKLKMHIQVEDAYPTGDGSTGCHSV